MGYTIVVFIVFCQRYLIKKHDLHTKQRKTTLSYSVIPFRLVRDLNTFQCLNVMLLSMIKILVYRKNHYNNTA